MATDTLERPAQADPRGGAVEDRTRPENRPEQVNPQPIHERLDQHGQRVGRMDQRIVGLEKTVGTIQQDQRDGFDAVGEGLERLHAHLGRAQRELGERSDPEPDSRPMGAPVLPRPIRNSGTSGATAPRRDPNTDDEPDRERSGFPWLRTIALVILFILIAGVIAVFWADLNRLWIRWWYASRFDAPICEYSVRHDGFKPGSNLPIYTVNGQDCSN